MYITKLASNEIFSPSNKIHREVGRAKDLSASLYLGKQMYRNILGVFGLARVPTGKLCITELYVNRNWPHARFFITAHWLCTRVFTLSACTLKYHFYHFFRKKHTKQTAVNNYSIKTLNCEHILIYCGLCHVQGSRYSDWTVRGSNPGGSEIFRTSPDRPCGPPTRLYNGHRVFPGGKAAGAWRWTTTIWRQG